MDDAERFERLSAYAQHDVGCEANDLDYLDHTPCTCGLRAILNPKGRADRVTTPPPAAPPEAREYRESAYQAEQRSWREAGFNAYNCDNIDEFPTWS